MVNIIETTFKFANSLEKRKSTNTIILHHADAQKCSVDYIHKWHIQRGWSGIGYHFFVRKDGTIFRGRPINAVGSHVLGHNADSIGICAEGNFEVELMGEKQRQAIIDLLKYLKEIYPNAKIVRHKDLKSTSCPGKNYPFDDIIKRINENKKGVVTASFLNFRSEPKVSNNIIGILKKDEAVEILQELGEWIKVKAQNKVGYVSSKYIKR